MKKIFVVLLTIICILSGCNTIPKCNDEQVKKLAVEAGIKSYLKQASYSNKIKMGSYLRGDENAFKSSNPFIDNLADGMVNSLSEYAALFGGNLDSLQVQIIDSTKNVGDITIDKIRVSLIDEELKQCDCEGNLNFKNIYYKINYSVQRAENGELYVKAIISAPE